MIDIENMGQDSLSSLSQEHLSEEEKSFPPRTYGKPYSGHGRRAQLHRTR